MERSSKNEIAYNRIKEMILQGRITSDHQISENILVKKLKMSRTPIRSALQRLQMEGFIKVVRNQGIFILGMSIEEAREKYDLRIALELYVIRKVIRLLSVNDLENLRRILDRQSEACQKADVLSFLQTDHEFHMYFLNVYKNKLIRDLISNLRERFYNIALKALTNEDRMNKSLEEHYDLLSTLEKKNLTKALQALEKNIEKGILHTMQTL
jgi:DNA-binding GntR family transcriptional regulator